MAHQMASSANGGSSATMDDTEAASTCSRKDVLVVTREGSIVPFWP